MCCCRRRYSYGYSRQCHRRGPISSLISLAIAKSATSTPASAPTSYPQPRVLATTVAPQVSGLTTASYPDEKHQHEGLTAPRAGLAPYPDPEEWEDETAPPAYRDSNTASAPTYSDEKQSTEFLGEYMGDMAIQDKEREQERQFIRTHSQRAIQANQTGIAGFIRGRYEDKLARKAEKYARKESRRL
jgi:hypothetical protein